MANKEGRTIDPKKQKLLISQHKEKHFTAGKIVCNIIIGVSDGVTVPFALAAGLSSANATSSIVLTAGIAKVAAGAISMGLDGFDFGKCYKISYIGTHSYGPESISMEHFLFQVESPSI
ncbi:hypothetical protein F8388_017452 [Cannabis sativa]|uniref:Vacuolar iron transporter n=1 Tax=Cannabis sativa TaxID=3483 RepID=A0A7J6IAS4_CANSA|nr:hypothetical protein F8388_017452 [Cannabis sativa]KAF4403760.1 hypothetical protein G4B88_002613 [Cannabis sativa]